MPEENSAEEKMLEFAQAYAKKAGFKLNDNKKELMMVIGGLVHNKEKYGFQYCPCRVVTGNKKEDAKKICPCFWHKDEIKKWGHCLCKLFWKK